MENLGLRNDERIIYKSIKVKTDGEKKKIKGIMILTNYDIIFSYKKGFFRKVSILEKFSLSQIKIVDSEAQVLFGKDENNVSQLEIYFNEYSKYFQFSSRPKREIKKWITLINDILGTACSQTVKNTDFIRPVAEGIVSTVITSVDAVKSALNKKDEQFVTLYCKSCGASLTGIKGKVVTCNYCHNRQTL